MGGYWWSVLVDGFWSSLEAVGQTLQVLIWAAIVFAIGLWRVGKHGGWAEMKKHVAQTWLEIVVVGVVAWLPFFVVYTARSSYLHWKNEQGTALQYKAEADTLQEELNGLAAPNLQGKIEFVNFGNNRKNGFLAITLEALITNTGAPSVAESFELYVTLLDGRKIYLPISVPPTALSLSFGKGAELIFKAQDFLPEKALSTPIPRGGAVSGFLQGYLIGTGVTRADVDRNGTYVTFSFADAWGKRSTAEVELTPSAAQESQRTLKPLTAK